MFFEYLTEILRISAQADCFGNVCDFCMRGVLQYCFCPFHSQRRNIGRKFFSGLSQELLADIIDIHEQDILRDPFQGKIGV